jgi:hypothetical protein
MLSAMVVMATDVSLSVDAPRYTRVKRWMEILPHSSHIGRKVCMLLANCNNSRGITGKTMPHKTQTAWSLHKQTGCPFWFTICFDQVGYYLLAGYGCAKHENHPKISQNAIVILTRLINKSERCILASVATANVTNAVGRNMHYIHSGNVIP